MRGRSRVVAGLIGLGLLAACTGDGEGGEAEPEPDSSDPATPTSTEAGQTSPDDGAPAEPTVALPDTAVGEFARAVVTATTSEATVGGSPAAFYLEYLAKVTEITGIPVGSVVEIDEQGFTLDQGLGRMPVIFSEIETTALGVNDLLMDGRAMTDIIDVVRHPVADPSGVEVLDGYGFTSYGPDRILLLTVHNGTDDRLTVDPALASFLRGENVRLSATSSGIEAPVEVAKGTTAEVILSVERGDGVPGGILELVLTRAEGAGDDAEIVVMVPMGGVQPTFFGLAPEGALRGALDADIAFDTGSAEPSDEALTTLFKASQEITAYDQATSLCVAGHADSVGTEGSNLDLSSARAKAIAAVLADYGVSNPIVAKGYGEAFAPGEEQDDPASRRVDVSFTDCPKAP